VVFCAGTGPVGGLTAVTGGSLSVAAAEAAPDRGGATGEVGGFCAAGTDEVGGLAGTGVAGVIRAVDG
jgi:hypothetical protein